MSASSGILNSWFSRCFEFKVLVLEIWAHIGNVCAENYNVPKLVENNLNETSLNERGQGQWTWM